MFRALTMFVLAAAFAGTGLPAAAFGGAAVAPSAPIGPGAVPGATLLWQNATKVTFGAPSLPVAMTYDLALGRVLGVSYDAASGLSQTWTYHSDRFANVSATDALPGLGPMVADPSAGNAEMFFAGPAGLETYGFVAGNWTPVPTHGAPAVANGTSWAVADDVVDRVVVLLLEGGFTWTLAGGNWTNLTALQGTRVIGSTGSGILNLAYDSTDHVVVFFGNATAPPLSGAGGHAATWIFSRGNWTELCPGCAPFARTPYAVSDEPGMGGLLVFGGNGSAATNETWIYAGGGWREVHGGASPSPRTGAALVYDVSDGIGLLYGGFSAVSPWNPLAETWWWDGNPLPHFRVFFHLTPPSDGAIAWNGVVYRDNASVNVTNGAYPVGLLVAGPGGWTVPPDLAWARVVGWNATPGLAVLGSTVFVNGSSGSIFVNLTALPIVEINGTGCGPVTVNGTPYGAGALVNLWAGGGPYTLNATLCSAGRFDGWLSAGGIAVADPASPNTTMNVSANGSLLASYTEIGNGPVITRLVAEPNPVLIGRTSALSVEATGGTTPYHVQYTGLPPGCPSADSFQLNCTPLRLGAYHVSVRIDDSLGGSVISQLTLWVEPGYRPLFVGAFFATVGPIVVGETTTLTVYLDGGEPPYSYHYEGLPPGCRSQNTGNASCTPTAAGSFHITVTVADAEGRVTSATLLLSVGPSRGWIDRAVADPLVWATAAAAVGAVAGAYLGFRWGRRPRTRPLAPAPPAA